MADASDEPGPHLLEDFPEVTGAAAALRARGWTVAVAESCTGGLLGAALTALPGSSTYVLGGVIAYDNTLKTGLLGVDAGTLAESGAVSEPVAAAMARGARERLSADVGVGITGVAGPGSEGSKPAGLVYVTVATPDSSRTVRLDRDLGRDGNRAAAVRAALGLIRELA